MKHQAPAHENVVSWLKFFDIEYLDDGLCNQLSELDVNSPVERAKAIRLAVRPDFFALNKVSKTSMLRVLNSALTASDEELAQLFARISMPFQSEITNRRQFLQSLLGAISIKPKE